MNSRIAAVASMLRNDTDLWDNALVLVLDGCTLRLRSNSAQLIARLKAYFSAAASGNTVIDIEVIAIERNAVDLGLKFTDWTREPGKSGRKDAYVDLLGGRVILKVRTGMVFLKVTN